MSALIIHPAKAEENVSKRRDESVGVQNAVTALEREAVLASSSDNISQLA